jgi:hypothetical protein
MLIHAPEAGMGQMREHMWWSGADQQPEVPDAAAGTQPQLAHRPVTACL